MGLLCMYNYVYIWIIHCFYIKVGELLPQWRYIYVNWQVQGQSQGKVLVAWQQSYQHTTLRPWQRARGTGWWNICGAGEQEGGEGQVTGTEGVWFIAGWSCWMWEWDDWDRRIGLRASGGEQGYRRRLEHSRYMRSVGKLQQTDEIVFVQMGSALPDKTFWEHSNGRRPIYTRTCSNGRHLLMAFYSWW